MHVLWCRLCQMHYCHLLSLSAVIYSGHGSNLKKLQLIRSVNAKNCKSGLMIKLRLTHPCHFTFAWSLWQKGVEAKENIVAMMTDKRQCTKKRDTDSRGT